MALKSRHLLGIEDLAPETIMEVLRTAAGFLEISERKIKKVPTLRGRTVINAFFEPSTRTRSSFEIAAKRLSADAINFTASTSSVSKGESLKDTGLTLHAMRPDVLVVRHPHSGAPAYLSRYCTDTHIINGGDGVHEHPTQALLDAMTILDHKESLQGLRAAIVGDISHSRVARSNALLLTRMGVDVRVCGPPTLIPIGFEEYGVEVTYDLSTALRDADVVMLLRTQWERQREVLFPSIREYFRLYGLNEEKMKVTRKDSIIMHPGPINRGVEIDPQLADGPYSVILDQVSNGVALRMALLYLILGGREE